MAQPTQFSELVLSPQGVRLYSANCVIPQDFKRFREFLLFAPLLASTLVSGYAAAPERSAQKLRSLAVFPVGKFTVGVSVSELNPDNLTSQELKRRIGRLRDKVARDDSDADGYLQLAQYLAAADFDEATNAYAKAAKLFRTRAESRPKDGETQALFAKALVGCGNEEEAERILRNATENAPSNWQCWAGLGDRLDSKAWSILFGVTNRIPSTEQFLEKVDSLSSRELTADQRGEVQAYRSEADKCFARVVAVAPRDSVAAFIRALHWWYVPLTERAFDLLTRKETDDTKNVFEIISTPETCAAFAEAAHLTQTNFAAIGSWGMLEDAPAMRNAAKGKPLETLSPARRKNVLEAISLLEKLGEHPDPKIAAGAFETLGFLNMLAAADANAAKVAFKQTITLDPERSGGWEGLAVMVANAGDFEELARICEKRLNYDDSPRNRLIYARALDLANLPTKAIEQAQKAVTLEPSSLFAQLYAGALLLKHPESSDADSEMRQHFAKALELIEAKVDAGKTVQLVVPYLLNSAIILALEGRSEEARETLRMVVRNNIEEQEYKDRLREIEKAIGN
jgi:tetratricopeptide (TPR) repeat protein